MSDNVRYVTSQDVSLYVLEAGEQTKPAILFLHGFPDDHRVWEKQFHALSTDFHVVCFDTRGVGNSSKSSQDDAYRIEKILKDIDAVITETVGPSGKVHLVGHDWGSVLGWSYVLHAQYQSRVLSWTSVSGPPLGIVWNKAKRDFLSFTPKRIGDAMSQLFSSWYIYSMFIPGFWEKIMMPTSALWHRPLVYGADLNPGDLFETDLRQDLQSKMKNAIGLYRDNVFKPPAMPKKHGCDVPTQVIVPTEDKFVRPGLLNTLDRYVNNIVYKNIKAGHWVQLTNAKEITTLIEEFINHHRDS